MKRTKYRDDSRANRGRAWGGLSAWEINQYTWHTIKPRGRLMFYPNYVPGCRWVYCFFRGDRCIEPPEAGVENCGIYQEPIFETGERKTTPRRTPEKVAGWAFEILAKHPPVDHMNQSVWFGMKLLAPYIDDFLQESLAEFQEEKFSDYILDACVYLKEQSRRTTFRATRVKLLTSVRYGFFFLGKYICDNLLDVRMSSKDKANIDKALSYIAQFHLNPT